MAGKKNIMILPSSMEAGLPLTTGDTPAGESFPASDLQDGVSSWEHALNLEGFRCFALACCSTCTQQLHTLLLVTDKMSEDLRCPTLARTVPRRMRKEFLRHRHHPIKS